MGDSYDPRRRIEGGVETLRRHPSLLVAGLVPTAGTAIGAALAPAFVQPSPRDPVLSAALFGIVLATTVVLRLVFTPALGPIYRAIQAAIVGEAEVWSDDGESPTSRLLGDAGFHVAILVGTLPLSIVVVAVAFVTVGTLLEAVGYLLAGTTLNHGLDPLGAVVVGLAATVVVDCLFGGLRVVDLRPSGMGRSKRLATGVRSLGRTPKSTLASATVVVATTVVPYAVGFETTLVALELDAGGALAVAAGVLAFSVVGTITYSLRTVHTVASARLFAKQWEEEPSPADSTGDRRRAIGLAALLVLGATLGGAALRMSDVRPPGGAGPPGDPTEKSPGEALEAAQDSLERGSYRAELRYYDPKGERKLLIRQVWWHSDHGRQIAIRNTNHFQDPAGAWAVYLSDETLAVTRGDAEQMGSGLPETFEEREPRYLASRTVGRVNRRPPIIFDPKPGDWRVVERSDDRVVLETTGRGAVARYTGLPKKYVLAGNMTAVLDRSTGRLERLRRSEVTRTDTESNETDQKLLVWNISDYGTTTVPSPTDPPKSATEQLYDLLVY